MARESTRNIVGFIQKRAFLKCIASQRARLTLVFVLRLEDVEEVKSGRRTSVSPKYREA